MKICKKFAGIATAAVCLLNAFSLGGVSLIAGAEKCSDKMTYGDYLSYKQVDENEDGTYDYVEISNCEKTAIEIEIPAEIDGLPVTSIGPYAFMYCTSLSSIGMPDSITSIGENAFSSCKSLVSMDMPSSITSIKEGVFLL